MDISAPPTTTKMTHRSFFSDVALKDTRPEQMHLPLTMIYPARTESWVHEPVSSPIATTFHKISLGLIEPEGAGGCILRTSDVVGFRGVGYADLAVDFHFLVIPVDRPDLKSVGDLTPGDIPMLIKMQHAATFWGIWNDLPVTQLGFHTSPTVDYLHMHVLSGPLTEYGWEQRRRWVSLDEVMGVLKSSKR